MNVKRKKNKKPKYLESKYKKFKDFITFLFISILTHTFTKNLIKHEFIIDEYHKHFASLFKLVGDYKLIFLFLLLAIVILLLLY